MSLHSGAYISDLLGHVSSKMLSLRQDEVSVFNRMNIHERRRISLPSKLSGITEKERVIAGILRRASTSLIAR